MDGWETDVNWCACTHLLSNWGSLTTSLRKLPLLRLYQPGYVQSKSFRPAKYLAKVYTLGIPMKINLAHLGRV